MKKRKKLQKIYLKVSLLLSKITEDFWKITQTEGNTFVFVFLTLTLLRLFFDETCKFFCIF